MAGGLERQRVVEIGAGEYCGDTEIQQNGFAVTVDQNVGRFEIAVDNHIAMGKGDRVANLEEQFNPLADVEPFLVTVGGDVAAVDVGHGHPRETVLGCAAIDKIGNTWVLQTRQDLLFFVKFFAPLGSGQLVAHHFQGHR